jgi:hypothetical protein
MKLGHPFMLRPSSKVAQKNRTGAVYSNPEVGSVCCCAVSQVPRG